MSPQHPSFPFDTSALTRPVTRAEISAHRDELRRTGRLPSRNIRLVVSAVFVVVGAVIMFLFAVGAFARGFFVHIPRRDESPLLSFVPLLLAGLVAIAAVVLTWSIIAKVRGPRDYRLDHFARANGMQWFPLAADPPLPGMIFSLGSERKALDIVRGTTPRLVEFGNYQFTTGTGKNKTTHRWGFVAVTLATPLPHIVLDAKSNNSLFGSNLPLRFHNDQALSLEGDFDRYFTLYCPREYEADALYLFTPDIMARFVDNAAAVDVEIVDDWLFLYGQREFSTTDPATWAWLFGMVGALLDKFSQWERWRDDRLASPTPASPPGAVPLFSAEAQAAQNRPPGVAREGRRLRSGTPLWIAAIVGGVILLSMYINMAEVLDTIFR